MNFMSESENKFFVFTNPLFYIYSVLIWTYALFELIPPFLGIKDWYYINYKLPKEDEEFLKKFLEYATKTVESPKGNIFIEIKRRRWKRAIEKCNKLLERYDHK